jgi:hypothetical protein
MPSTSTRSRAKIQHQPGLIDGCLAGTGLALEPDPIDIDIDIDIAN